MRLLLDTHAFWFLADHPALSKTARETIEDPANSVTVSIVSAWEITIKQRIGKIKASLPEIFRELPSHRFALMPIEPPHLMTLTTLASVQRHNDPFDHLLIAQAIAEDMTFVSNDRHVPFYEVQHLRCSDPA